ncbi:glycoside hydrolase family 19 protein [Taibaiella lutea]|uniref:Glycoside hydrolase family 19 protein n=1 Tax=Taibaiella lutea TaxID=2608001 RepID=A0A5M6CEY3_9BACT|nr:glycoside hydrolase family 19 protein [Taibaiella lutea]KAA5533734.1 glycoside hydrolase family 19 protein [Taibaiella lutea]
MIDEKILRAIVPTAPKTLGEYVPFLNQAFENFGIDTPQYQAAFIAQIAHESGAFRYVKEIASGKAYDTGSKAKALGNTPEADGDGQRYKGRGLIQITGKNNYSVCSLALFNDERLLTTPELLETPQYAVYSAAWFWSSNRLNRYVDKNDFTGLTKRINGGINGLAEREKYCKAAQKLLCQ